MSLLAQVNQPSGNLTSAGAPQYYFPLDSTPDDPVVTAQAFDAIGTGTPPNGGSFTANAQDLTGAGQDAFIMAAAGGTARWAMGMSGVEAGANSGSNLAMFAYADDGSFLSAPIQITRATGGVIMPVGLSTAQAVVSGLTSTESLIVGQDTDVGGGVAQVNGTLGVATIYDDIYNRPVAGIETLTSTYGPTGVPGPLPVYTAPNTGLYTLTMEVKADANGGFAWTNGVNNILGYLQNPFPPFDLLSDAFLACDSIANPTGMVLPTPGGAVQNDAYVKDIVAVVNLVGGTTYAAQANFNPAAFNLGTTGGVRFFIQPLLA
jgi:hypothetical protein